MNVRGITWTRASWMALLAVVGVTLAVVSTFLTWSSLSRPELFFYALGAMGSESIHHVPGGRDVWQVSRPDGVQVVAGALLVALLGVTQMIVPRRHWNSVRLLMLVSAVLVFLAGLGDLMAPPNFGSGLPPARLTGFGADAGAGEVAAVLAGLMLAVFAWSGGFVLSRNLPPADETTPTPSIAGPAVRAGVRARLAIRRTPLALAAAAVMIASTFFTWSNAIVLAHRIYTYQPGGGSFAPGQSLWTSAPGIAVELVLSAVIIAILPSRWATVRPLGWLASIAALAIAGYTWLAPPDYRLDAFSGFHAYLGQSLSGIISQTQSNRGAGESIAVIGAVLLTTAAWMRHTPAPGNG